MIDDYSDTDYYEQAFAEKAEVQAELGKSEEARQTIENYLKAFPQGRFRGRMEEIAGQIPRK